VQRSLVAKSEFAASASRLQLEVHMTPRKLEEAARKGVEVVLSQNFALGFDHAVIRG
jgi:hypothetical protein